MEVFPAFQMFLSFTFWTEKGTMMHMVQCSWFDRFKGNRLKAIGNIWWGKEWEQFNWILRQDSLVDAKILEKKFHRYAMKHWWSHSVSRGPALYLDDDDSIMEIRKSEHTLHSLVFVYHHGEEIAWSTTGSWKVGRGVSSVRLDGKGLGFSQEGGKWSNNSLLDVLRIL